jgi:peptidoglycan/LPS O-acetylase OafA/YrhL
MRVDPWLRPASFRPDVQGLRAIAVLLVLLFHFETPIKGGYLGVDMFFVISGFVIASSTLREIDKTHSFSWQNFLR